MKKIRIPYRKYSFEIYDRPTRRLKRADVLALQKRLVSIAASRLGMTPDFSFFRDPKYLENKLVIICHDRKQREDFCFCAMSYLGKFKRKNIIHLGAVYSRNENRGLMQMVYFFGMMYIFIKNWFFRKVYLTSLTHTPKIFGVVAESFEKVYPNLDPDARPLDFHHSLKDAVLNTYLREWEFPSKIQIDGNFVIRGFRIKKDGTILYPDTIETVPKHRNDAYTRRCSELIDYARGDVVLQCGVAYGFYTIFKNSKILSKG